MATLKEGKDSSRRKGKLMASKDYTYKVVQRVGDMPIR